MGLKFGGDAVRANTMAGAVNPITVVIIQERANKKQSPVTVTNYQPTSITSVSVHSTPA